MGALNKGARANGGEIIGIIHKQFCVDSDEDKLITNMIKVDGNNLNDRKDLLLDNSDCIIILPGGCGTFDEFWDCISSKSLGIIIIIIIIIIVVIIIIIIIIITIITIIISIIIVIITIIIITISIIIVIIIHHQHNHQHNHHPHHHYHHDKV